MFIEVYLHVYSVSYDVITMNIRRTRCSEESFDTMNIIGNTNMYQNDLDHSFSSQIIMWSDIENLASDYPPTMNRLLQDSQFLQQFRAYYVTTKCSKLLEFE